MLSWRLCSKEWPRITAQQIQYVVCTVQRQKLVILFLEKLNKSTICTQSKVSRDDTLSVHAL